MTEFGTEPQLDPGLLSASLQSAWQHQRSVQFDFQLVIPLTTHHPEGPRCPLLLLPVVSHPGLPPAHPWLGFWGSKRGSPSLPPLPCTPGLSLRL